MNIKWFIEKLAETTLSLAEQIEKSREQTQQIWALRKENKALKDRIDNYEK